MPAPDPSVQTSPQLPTGEQIFLDHVGHFVADVTAAEAALARAGFAATPVSVQVNPDPAGGAPKPTGTGNVCAMLRAGYIEVLFKTADTPLGGEHDAARARYDGLHLAAFAIADADRAHARLAGAGFAMQPVVKMQRPVKTATGEGVAAFEVVRLVPGQMPEGRIQVLRHKTEDTVWQPRWLDHPNGARALEALVIVVADVDEAAQRLQRFTGRAAQPIEGGLRLELDRGEVDVITASTWRQRWPAIPVPSLPFIGECRIGVGDIEMTKRCLANCGLHSLGETDKALSVAFPAALGSGVWTFRHVE